MCRVVCGGYVLLTVGVLACALALVSPFWILYPSDTDSGSLWDKMKNLGNAFVQEFGYPVAEGLSGAFYKDKTVVWLWDNDFRWEKSRPDWYKASQGLYAAGLLLLIVAWGISTFHVCCCRCCKESGSVTSALGSLTLSGVVLISASIAVFAAFAIKERAAGFNQSGIMFYWAFFVAIAGVVIVLVTVIMYFCDGCRTRSHSGYHMTRVV